MGVEVKKITIALMLLVIFTAAACKNNENTTKHPQEEEISNDEEIIEQIDEPEIEDEPQILYEATIEVEEPYNPDCNCINSEPIEENFVVFNGVEYRCTQRFLNSRTGRRFQYFAYTAAMAFWAGDIETLRNMYSEESFQRDYEYLQIIQEQNWEITFFALILLSENIYEQFIHLDYEFSYVGNETAIFLMMVIGLDENGNWKVFNMGLER
jgi:hypothetical protein